MKGRFSMPVDRRRARRMGGALVLALSSVAVVSILSLSYLGMNAAVSARQTTALDAKLAFYAAEAGLAEAYSGLTVGRTGAVGSIGDPALFGGDAVLWVESTQLGDRRVQLDATGMCRTGRAVLSMVVERDVETVGSLGFFTTGELEIPPGVRIDGYDSRLGSYAEQAADPDSGASARVGSNGAVTVTGSERAPTVVDGDVSPGPRAAVATAGDVTITGETESALEALGLLPVSPPAVELLSGYEHLRLAPLVVQSGTYGAEFLRVGAGAEAILEGPVTVVLGELSVADGGLLSFDTSAGPIDLYVTGPLSLGAGSEVGTSGTDPTRTTVQVAGEGPVELAATGAFHGLVYAPDAAVSLAAGFEVFGGIAAAWLQLGVGASLHYDEALAARAAGEGSLPDLLSWRIVELGDISAENSGRNPFDVLGVDRSTLRTPYEAHADQHIAIRYEDTSLARASYVGQESAFDWSHVARVLELSRDGERVVRGVDEVATDLERDPVLALLDELSGGALKAELLDHSPLSAQVLLELLVRGNLMSSSDHKEVLRVNVPLPEGRETRILTAVLDKSPSMSSGDLKAVFLEHSPLPADFLVYFELVGLSVMSASDYLAVLDVQD